MAERLKPRKRASCGDSSSSKTVKQQIRYTTLQKWQAQYNTDHKTLTWLHCDKETGNARIVLLLWCEVCRSYERKICSNKNFSRVWINGSGNHRTSNVIDHATSSQHKAAMKCLKFDQARKSQQPLAAVAPIVGSMMKLDTVSRERLCRKFDISFVMAKEGYRLRSMDRSMN